MRISTGPSPPIYTNLQDETRADLALARKDFLALPFARSHQLRRPRRGRGRSRTVSGYRLAAAPGGAPQLTQDPDCLLPSHPPTRPGTIRARRVTLQT